MKNTRKIVALLLVGIFALAGFGSPTVYAGNVAIESNASAITEITDLTELIETLPARLPGVTKADDTDDGSVSRAPAPPVTSVAITGVYTYLDNNGVRRFVAEVVVVGYGNRSFNVTGGLSNPVEINNGYIGNPVVAFWHHYDLGPVVNGTTTFTINSKSYNYPWNTMGARATITWSGGQNGSGSVVIWNDMYVA